MTEELWASYSTFDRFVVRALLLLYCCWLWSCYSNYYFNPPFLSPWGEHSLSRFLSLFYHFVSNRISFLMFFWVKYLKEDIKDRNSVLNKVGKSTIFCLKQNQDLSCRAASSYPEMLYRVLPPRDSLQVLFLNIAFLSASNLGLSSKPGFFKWKYCLPNALHNLFWKNIFCRNTVKVVNTTFNAQSLRCRYLLHICAQITSNSF